MRARFRFGPKFRLAVLFFLPALCGTSIAAEEKSIETDLWLDLMRPAVVSPMCNKKDPMRICFDITREECEKSALAAASNCSRLLRPKMPAVMTSEEVRPWGGTLGVCTIKAYIFANSGRLLEDKDDCGKWRQP